MKKCTVFALVCVSLVAQTTSSDLIEIRTGLTGTLDRIDKLIAATKPPVTIIKAGNNLQAAINEAKPGDTLALEAGAEFRGNFTLPKKTGDAAITITSTAADKLPAGVRVKPADAVNMPRIVSPNTSGAITAASGAHDWRLVALDISAPGVYSGGLLRLSDGGETKVEDVPQRITVERCYIHGDPKVGAKRGVNGNSRGFTLRDSYISDIKATGQDTQAFVCYSCDTVLVENNYLEASGENVFIAELGKVPGYIPHDITITRNHIRKLLSWRDGTDAPPTGGKWTCKNLFELKAGIRVRFAGNVLENSWVSGQTGMAINLKPGAAPTVNASRTEDVVIENNLVIGAAIGFQISGTDVQAPNVGVGLLRRVTIRNNALLNMGDPIYGGPARLIQMVMSPSAEVTFERNTITGPAVNGAFSSDGIASPGFVFRGNLMAHGPYGFKAPGQPTGLASINVSLPGAVWENNIFIHAPDLSGKYPAGTRFVSAVAFGPDGYSQADLPGVGVDAGKLSAAIAGVRQ